MPTPILIDGFEHKVASSNGFGATTEGLAATIVGTPTFPSGRTGTCIRFTNAGSAVYMTKRIPDPSIAVLGWYYRLISGNGGTTFFVSTPAFEACARLYVLTAGNQVGLQVGGSTVTYEGPALNDGTWHRFDMKIDLSANPWSVTWAIDGTAMTPATWAHAADSIRYVKMGGESSETRTDEYDDLVISATSADYPLGPHEVLFSLPTGDGTHNAGTNTIEDNAGTDITSPNAFPLLDEWAPNTTDYVQQVAAGASNYAEVTFADAAAGKAIWGVEGVAALFSSNTNANAGTTRIVDSGGTTLTDIYAGSMAQTSLHYRRAIIADPGGGGWSKADYDGLKARVGFSTDVDGQPRWSAVLLQYAAVDSAVPTGLTATAVSSSQINLEWDDYAGATGYDIERNGAVIVFDHPVSSYNDTGLSPSTLYTYRVRAVL